MNRNKGFTLLELLLVISILGILVSLILPRFEDVRTNANSKVCVANLRGMSSVMAIYETAKNASVTWTGKYPEVLVQWQYLSVAPYCPYAPSSPSTGDRYTLTTSTSTTPDKATCPYEVGTAPDGNTYPDHHWP